jgi:hypothetical protein
MTSLPTSFSCPCGKIFLPIGSKYSNDGMNITIFDGEISKNYDLVHNTDSVLEAGQLFATSSTTIDGINNLQKILVNLNNTVTLYGQIKVIVSVLNTSNYIGLKILGIDNQLITISEIEIDDSSILDRVIDSGVKLRIDIISICDLLEPDCCDKLPSEFILYNKVPSICTHNITPKTYTVNVCLKDLANRFSTITRTFSFSVVQCSTTSSTTTTIPPTTTSSTTTIPPTTSSTTTTLPPADCCQWDGSSYIEFTSCSSGAVTTPIQFIEISPNIWEFNGYTECGDYIEATITCDPKVIYTGPESCSTKWSLSNATVSCVTGFAIVGIKEPCTCNVAPIWLFTGNVENCLCCSCESQPCSIDPTFSRHNNYSIKTHTVDECERTITLNYQSGPSFENDPIISIPNKYDIYCEGVLIASTNGWVGGSQYANDPLYQPFVGGPVGTIVGIKPARATSIEVVVGGDSASLYDITCT